MSCLVMTVTDGTITCLERVAQSAVAVTKYDGRHARTVTPGVTACHDVDTR